MNSPTRPGFAEAFPRAPELEALVAAFVHGDYRYVRARAAVLEKTSSDAEVRRAAGILLERTRPDPLVVVLIVIAALLLTFMSSWWILHGNPPPR